MVFQKEFFENFNFEKIGRWQKKLKNYLVKELKYLNVITISNIEVCSFKWKLAQCSPVYFMNGSTHLSYYTLKKANNIGLLSVKYSSYTCNMQKFQNSSPSSWAGMIESYLAPRL